MTSGKRFVEVLGTFCRTIQERPEDIAVMSGESFFRRPGDVIQGRSKGRWGNDRFSKARCALALYYYYTYY